MIQNEVFIKWSCSKSLLEKFCCQVIYLNSLRKCKNFMKVAVKMTRNNMSKEEFHMVIDRFIILIP